VESWEGEAGFASAVLFLWTGGFIEKQEGQITLLPHLPSHNRPRKLEASFPQID